MSREELLTEEEELNLKNALEHIEDLEHLMKKRPVETFKSLLKLNCAFSSPMTGKSPSTVRVSDLTPAMLVPTRRPVRLPAAFLR